MGTPSRAIRTHTRALTGPLDADLRAVLDLEREWASVAAAGAGVSRARWIRERTGMTPIRYQQLLHRALDHPESAAYAPGVVPRLLRLRAQRRRRAGRGAGSD